MPPSFQTGAIQKTTNFTISYNSISNGPLEQKFVRADHAAAYSVHDERGRVVDPKFRHHVLPVRSHCVAADKESLCNRSVGVAFSDEGENFLFSFCQSDRVTGELLNFEALDINAFGADCLEDLAAKKC